MASFKITIFNVERGLCIYARTPNNYGVMIDCGCSPYFSPAAYLAKREVPTLNRWNGHALAHLIVTHPHDDHVEDIDNVKTKFAPAILHRHKNYDWDVVLDPPDGDPSENAKAYYRWQQTYSSPVTQRPDLGLEMKTYSLTPSQAKAIDPNPQHLLNNSSYVTVFTYQPPGCSMAWKVVVAGDNETAGWEALLREAEFRSSVAEADFFVTPHHGHESGFSGDLFEAMGNPILNITSERAGDQSVSPKYRAYAKGAHLFGEDRYHLTTRCDGHIVITMSDNMKYQVVATNHE